MERKHISTVARQFKRTFFSAGVERVGQVDSVLHART